jgi:hypothetical protein
MPRVLSPFSSRRRLNSLRRGFVGSVQLGKLYTKGIMTETQKKRNSLTPRQCRALGDWLIKHREIVATMTPAEIAVKAETELMFVVTEPNVRTQADATDVKWKPWGKGEDASLFRIQQMEDRLARIENALKLGLIGEDPEWARKPG